MDRIGKWLQPLGRIVCAANGRDLSAEDQKQQLDDAHGELYKELRRMDHVQADLLEALESARNELVAMKSEIGFRGMTLDVIGACEAAIARARGEA